MKRTTVVLSAAAVMGLPATTFADDLTGGWGAILNHQTRDVDPIATSLTGIPAEHVTGERKPLFAGPACSLWDNGLPDSVNGYSNGTVDAFGARRTLLDDFVVPEGKEWTITGMHHYHVWNTGSPGDGTDMQVIIWSDGSGTPGAPLGVAVVSSYSEDDAGSTYFDRDGVVSFTQFDPAIVLEAGRYWMEGTVVGPENNFWLTAPVLNEECWVNYDDLGGLQSGTGQFGVASDVSWCFDGTEDAGPTNANGLRHFTLGGAQLTRNGNGTLTVSNIGSSGKDGFTSELGDGAGGWGGTGEMAAPAGAATMDVINVGTLNGNPDTAMGGTQVVFGTSLVDLGATLDGLDATTYTQTLYNGGVIVDCIENIPGGSLSASTSPVEVAKCFCKLLAPPANLVWEIAIDAAVSVTTANGSFDADRIEFTPTDPTPGIESVSRIEATLADTADLDVTSETIQMFGVGNTKVGGARLVTSGGSLQVTGIGVSGNDGLSMSLPSATNLDVTTEAIATSSNGDAIDLIATGTFGGTPDTQLGHTLLANGSGFIVTDSDFSAISASNLVRVEVYDDGALIGSGDVPGGGNFETLILNGAEGSFNIIGFGKRPVDGGDPPCYYFQFDRNANIQPIGNPVFSGDEVRLLVAEPDAAITSLSQMDVLMRQNQLTVTGASYSALATGGCCIGDGCGVFTEEQCVAAGGDYQGDDVPCKPNPCGGKCTPDPDTDHSGCVDFADILVILSAWGGSGPEGDADCSGIVDFADILEVLSAWGDGCDP